MTLDLLDKFALTMEQSQIAWWNFERGNMLQKKIKTDLKESGLSALDVILMYERVRGENYQLSCKSRFLELPTFPNEFLCYHFLRIET